MKFHPLNYLGTRWKIGTEIKMRTDSEHFGEPYVSSDNGIIIGFVDYDIAIKLPNGSTPRYNMLFILENYEIQ